MGWAKDMQFLGGYLSPAVLAEEIERERAAQSAAVTPASAKCTDGRPAGVAAVQAVGAANLAARPCA